MTKKEAIDRWAKCVIPAVMMAESKLLEDKPVWREWLSHVTLENGSELADMYCREIAEIIVRNSPDYDPNEETNNN
jgi:hypothetical protein